VEAQNAITLAKSQVSTIFADEGVVNVGLEELEYDSANGTWKVTIGFSRPWDVNTPNLLNNAMNVPPLRRTYKVVTIDDTSGRFLSVSNRETQSA
jgi:hypothetical protein